MNKKGYVYLLASKFNGTLYIGVTSDLVGRVYEHKMHLMKGFTQQYNVTRLVWFEEFDRVTDAIYREKQIKKWNREWKISLIKKQNPSWKDLYNELV